MLGACGIDCKACKAYLATKEQSQDKYREIAELWSSPGETYKPEDIPCDGCSGERLHEFCKRCYPRRCAKIHGVEVCGECPSYPCSELESLWRSFSKECGYAARANMGERARSFKHRDGIVAAIRSPRPSARIARIAGLLYLVNAITSSIGFKYGTQALITPGSSVLMVPGDPGATIAKILASESLFRLGMVCELVSGIALLLLAIALYNLLSGVNKTQARLMVAFVLVSVPITFLNVLNELSALGLIHSGASSGFSQSQLDSLVMLSLDLHSQGLVVDAIFWGLWLVPFGFLIHKSGFIPRILGILVGINGITWILGSLSILLSLPFARLAPTIVVIPFGEPLMIAWLLLKGVSVKQKAHQGHRTSGPVRVGKTIENST